MEDEKKAKKADWLKKTKKKPKSEEEELKDLEDLKNKVCHNMTNIMIDHKLDKSENDVELARTKWLMDNHLKMDENMYDELNRKESILDINISGKDLILRLDLDVPLSPYTPPPPVQEEKKEDHNKS